MIAAILVCFGFGLWMWAKLEGWQNIGLVPGLLFIVGGVYVITRWNWLRRVLMVALPVIGFFVGGFCAAILGVNTLTALGIFTCLLPGGGLCILIWSGRRDRRLRESAGQ